MQELYSTFVLTGAEKVQTGSASAGTATQHESIENYSDMKEEKTLNETGRTEQAPAHVHQHGHGHHHHMHGDSEKNIATAFFLNAFFVVVEVVGGLFTNSIAILSDALHDFGDCLSLGFAWFMQRKSKQSRDANYTYGYKRYSLLGSLFLSAILTVSSIFIFVEATKRILHPEAINATGMIWISILGILFNGGAALGVHRGTSLNERAVYLHIMEDVLGWIAVLIASVVMKFTDWPWIDPVLSIGISIWVLYNVFGNFHSIFRVLLQGAPDDISIADLKKDIEAVKGVESIHDFHIWSLDGESNVMSIHVVTEDEDTLSIKKAILHVIHEYNVEHVTMEFEKPGIDCLTSCDGCHEHEHEHEFAE